LGFILSGAVASLFLLPPSMLLPEAPNHKNEEDEEKAQHAIEETNLLEESKLDPVSIPLELEETTGATIIPMCSESEDTWLVEVAATVRLFFTKPMLTLSILFFYSDFNQPYQQATFGNRFFTKRSIGVELIVFHLMEILGALFCGRLLDGELSNVHSKKQAAIWCLASFVLINATGNVIAFAEELGSIDGTAVALDISDPRSFLPSLAFACWGWADSQINLYAMWLIGTLYSSASEHARAIGFYKCSQSLGYALGFYLMPVSRMNALAQLTLSTALFLLGTGLSVLELPN
jgi:hypothetical protein